MPKSSIYCSTCAYPIIFDTYRGCSHGCKYCFANFRTNYDRIPHPAESVESLKSWIAGKRGSREKWADWDIPISWGRNSDPFIPRDKIFKRSLSALKVFARTKYPFIVTTKSVLPAEEPYFSLFKECNCVFQYSIACEEMDALEPGTAGFEARLKAMEKLAPFVKCMTARISPIFLDYAESIKKNLPRFAAAGASVCMLSLAYSMTRKPGMEPLRTGRYSYPKAKALPVLRELKSEAEKCGMKAVITNFTEEREHPNCCGIEHVPGFAGNYCTVVARDYFGGKYFSASAAQSRAGTGNAFRNCFKSLSESELKKVSFEDVVNSIEYENGE